MYQVFN